jgi:AbiV family abortive infection protein
MNAAAKRAAQLLSDSEVLLESGSYASAAAVAILAIEEAEKVSVLREIAVAESDSELKQAWKGYRSHTRKNATWLLAEMYKSGARKADDFAGLLDEDADHPYILDQLKQLSFHTDCLGSGTWSEPHAVVDRQLAESLVTAARVFDGTQTYSARELELWVELVGPALKRDGKWVKLAMINWYAAMRKEGLIPSGKNEIPQFIREGLDPDP